MKEKKEKTPEQIEKARIRSNEIRSRFDKANTRKYSLKLNIHTDADIIEALGQVPNVQAYIKELIRANQKDRKQE